MREIKFRGYGKDARHWIFGSLLDEKSAGIVAIQDDNCHVWEVERESVGQYTGLKDANRREIYEGDVIRSVMLPHMRTAVCNGCVEYRNGAFYVEYTDHTYANLGDLIFYSGTSTTVIGNVHDNPELLEVEHDRRD